MMRAYLADLQINDRVFVQYEPFDIDLHPEEHPVHRRDLPEFGLPRDELQRLRCLDPRFQISVDGRITDQTLSLIEEMAGFVNFAAEFAFAFEDVAAHVIKGYEPALIEHARTTRDDAVHRRAVSVGIFVEKEINARPVGHGSRP